MCHRVPEDNSGIIYFSAISPLIYFPYKPLFFTCFIVILLLATHIPRYNVAIFASKLAHLAVNNLVKPS